MVKPTTHHPLPVSLFSPFNTTAQTSPPILPHLPRIPMNSAASHQTFPCSVGAARCPCSNAASIISVKSQQFRNRNEASKAGEARALKAVARDGALDSEEARRLSMCLEVGPDMGVKRAIVDSEEGESLKTRIGLELWKSCRPLHLEQVKVYVPAASVLVPAVSEALNAQICIKKL